MNPGGSIKDRIGLSMIEEAEKRGDLKPGGTIVEATAGNTGLGLALVAAQKGYRLILVLPDKMSQEKIFNLRALGAEVVLTRSDVAQGPSRVLPGSGRRDREEDSARTSSISSRIPTIPKRTRRRPRRKSGSRWRQRLDAVVVGVGSSGTIAGLAAFFKKHAPHVELVLADPQGSILAEYIETGQDDAEGMRGSSKASARISFPRSAISR